MKITDPKTIRNGEKDLLDAVHSQLDMPAVTRILMASLSTDAFASRGGEIVVHDNQVAFRLDFDVHLSGSLLFDREGNYIPTSPDAAETNTSSAPPQAQAAPPPPPEPEPSEDRISDDLDDLGDLDILDEDPPHPVNEDIMDDDIHDILKESRQFWDQKKPT